MKTIVIAIAILAGLGGSAHAQYGAAYERWETMMGKPTIPGTVWFGMASDQRRAMVRRMQIVTARSMWPDNSCGQMVKIAECMLDDQPLHNKGDKNVPAEPQRVARE
jgi:hypothetical protein